MPSSTTYNVLSLTRLNNQDLDKTI